MSEQPRQGKKKKKRELPPIEPVGAPFVDSHCHLTYGTLAKEPEAVVSRARAVGVGGMLTISTKLETFPEVLALAERFDGVWASVGTHPHHAQAEQEQVSAQRLVELAAHPKVIAIGEAGLDYFYDRSPRDVQQRVFREHIAAARETGLPLVIHTREAEEDTAAILQEETARGAFSFVMHCFSSAPWLAQRAVELGGYVSFSGILTFKKSEEVRRAALDTPLERLLVETDAPFLAPEPYRGRICEPAHTAVTLRYLADLKGCTAEELARITSENFFRLFGKAQPPAVFAQAA
jgi:TatD DNase family protein